MKWNFVRQASGPELTELCNELDMRFGFGAPNPQAAVFEVRHPQADIPQDIRDSVRPTAISLVRNRETRKVYPSLQYTSFEDDSEIADTVLAENPDLLQPHTITVERMAFQEASLADEASRHLRLLPADRDMGIILEDRFDMLSAIWRIAREHGVAQSPTHSWDQEIRPDLTVAYRLNRALVINRDTYYRALRLAQQLTKRVLPFTVTLGVAQHAPQGNMLDEQAPSTVNGIS